MPILGGAAIGKFLIIIPRMAGADPIIILGTPDIGFTAHSLLAV
jgi:hypothetical protein